MEGDTKHQFHQNAGSSPHNPSAPPDYLLAGPTNPEGTPKYPPGYSNYPPYPPVRSELPLNVSAPQYAVSGQMTNNYGYQATSSSQVPPGYTPPGQGYHPVTAAYAPQSPQGYDPSPDPYNYGGPSTTALDINGDQFSEKTIRMAFIRKVYAILIAQLVVTFGIISLFVYQPDVNRYARTNDWLFWFSWGVALAMVITLTCCGQIRRRTPHNFIFLAIFTLAEGLMLGVTTSFFQANEVLLAVGICVGVSLALTLFAFQTKIDFTTCSGILFVGVIVLLFFGIFCIIFPSRIMSIVYASLGALIFSCYIVVDTQLMMGGKHKYALSPEEYIFAALNLYLDIVQLFLYILIIIGNSKN